MEPDRGGFVQRRRNCVTGERPLHSPIEYVVIDVIGIALFMTASSPPTSDVAAAMQLLNRGDLEAAQGRLKAILASHPNDLTANLGLAMAYAQAGERERCNAILDDILQKAPRHFAALLLKADNLLAMGRKREAGSFYNAAISVAPPPQQHNASVKAGIERARKAGQQLMAAYEGHLRQALSDEGFDTSAHRPGAASEAIDILFGKREIFVQQPEQFYFPGLPQRQFYDREDFGWAQSLEAQTEAIAKEAQILLDLDGAFRPYQHAAAGKPRMRESALYGKEDWSAAYLIRAGEVNGEIAERCPATMAALEGLPLCDVPGKNPSVLFSLLKPGTHIAPHHGLVNTRLIGHLPLIVPAGCSLRVGNARRYWRKGELMVFDDSIEHEAHNPTADLRIVLLFDIWRPELTERDRHLVRSLFAAIDRWQD